MRAELSGTLAQSTAEPEESRFGKLIPLSWRAKPFRIGIIVFSVIILVVGMFLNVRLHLDRVRLEEDVKQQEQALSTLPSILRQLETERNNRVNFIAERDLLYAGVPDLSNIPLITTQLEDLASLTSGRILRINYTPAAWSNNRSEVVINVRYEGTFLSVMMYLNGIRDSFPTAKIKQFALERNGSDASRVTLEAMLSVAVLETREQHFAPWDDRRLMARAVAPVASPFDAPLRAWNTGRQLGLHLPQWTLTGIIENRGSRTALLNVNGDHQVVRVGDLIHDVEVVAIRDNYIELRMDGRQSVLRLEGH